MEPKANRQNRLVLEKAIPSDLETPVSAFLKVRSAFPKSPAFLLESVERGEQVGRYSILGFSSCEILRWTVKVRENPFLFLADAMKKFSAEISFPLPFPFGAFGYLSYDAVSSFEPKVPVQTHSPFPDAYFVVPERMILFDHVRNTMTLFVLTNPEEEKQALNQFEKDLRETLLPSSATLWSSPGSFTSSETRESYLEKVKKVKEYIRAGEIFQGVLSQQLKGTTKASSIDIYRALRILNPSPYMYFLDFDSFQLIGSSPETLVKVQEGIAETKPIAGTRPRGKTAQEDAILETELLEDPKERAEHTMLVDLGRNDLGKVCRYGTVEVIHPLEVERYSHVMHLVSTVRGIVSSEKSSLDVLQAVFPAGTVSGAPKVRAMEIIAELEKVPRSLYAGCVGYVGFTGNLDTCITLRSILKEKENITIQAGAGIVADSDPAREYEETLNKMEGLREAVRMAERGNDMGGVLK